LKLLNGTEAEAALTFFEKAAAVAKQSLCLRALCGSIIVKNGAVIAEGFNSPPQNNDALRTCLNEYDIPTGFRHDRTCCIHAEQRAIQDGLKNGQDMIGARIYFINIDRGGIKQYAKDLKCTICSRAALDQGISEFTLYREEGIAVYDTTEFDRLSYEYKTPRK
jgi:deoxycytidylate deaminase